MISEIQGFGEGTWRKRPLGRPRYRCEYNIKMINKESSCEGVEWIYLSQDVEKLRAFLNTVMHIRVP